MKTSFQKQVLALLALFYLVACSDDTNIYETDEPLSQLETYEVKNLLSESGSASYTDHADPIYYNLDENKIVSKNLVQTSKWDIQLSGAYNTSIIINNKNDKNSPGYGGSGTAKMYLYKATTTEKEFMGKDLTPKKVATTQDLNRLFNNLVEVPELTAMEQKTEIGLNHSFGTTDGWCYYDMGGILFPDQPYKVKGHIIYALPRVIVIKTNQGNYVKLLMQSIYKDAPENPYITRKNKPGYIHFKYTIQKNGTPILN